MATPKKSQNKASESSSIDNNEMMLELQRQIKELQDQLSDKASNKTTSSDDVDIRPDKTIPVMSLLPWQLVLSSGRSNKSYIFNKLFQIKRIPYGDLRDILDDNWTFAESGYFQVLNEDVVRLYGLEEAYEKALNREGFEKIFNEDAKKSIPLIESINAKQLEVIANMIIAKMRDGETVDMNLVYAVSSKSGIDIVEKVELAKSLVEIK